MVLHHCEPTVIGFLYKGRILIVNIGKIELLEVFFTRIESRSSKRRIHRAFACRLARVARDLIVNLGGNSLFSLIRNGRGDIHAVIAALEGIGLCNLNSALVCFKDNIKLVGTIHGKRLAHQLELIGMRRIVAAHKPALRHVGMRALNIKKLDVAEIISRLAAENHAGKTHFSPVRLLREEKHLRTNYTGPLKIKRDLHSIRSNDHRFLDRSCRGLNFNSPCILSRSRNIRCTRTLRGFNSLFRSSKERLPALIDLIIVPKHEKRSEKDHPQKGTLNFSSHKALLD